MALRVSRETFEKEVVQSEKTVLADFYSDSCVPCKRLSPVLAEIEEENKNIKVVKINIGFDLELAERYNILTVPTLILLKSGEESGRVHGAVKKSDIEELIKK